jgi:SAM-dependent methyltransferase
VIAAVATLGGDVGAVRRRRGRRHRRRAAVVAGGRSSTTSRPPRRSDAASRRRSSTTALQDLLDDSDTPLAFLVRQVPAAGTVIEIGPGAGGLSALLGPRAKKKHIVIDLSLRSVLLARRAGGPRALGVIADACALPIADGAADVVVAENIIDVVEDADAFIAGAHRALRRGGVLALTTPGPELDGGPDVDARLRAAGFIIDEVRDGLRWPRVHGRRHVELWTCRGIVARRR